MNDPSRAYIEVEICILTVQTYILITCNFNGGAFSEVFL